jgi:hypothetical protein
MALSVNDVKQQLREYRDQKADLERKIRALEDYLGVPKKGASNGALVVRGGPDITPTVQAIFSENNNQPIRKRDLTDIVAARHPEVEKAVVERKMINVTRKILAQDGYGKYRLAFPLG